MNYHKSFRWIFTIWKICTGFAGRQFSRRSGEASLAKFVNINQPQPSPPSPDKFGSNQGLRALIGNCFSPLVHSEPHKPLEGPEPATGDFVVHPVRFEFRIREHVYSTPVFLRNFIVYLE